MMIMKSDTAVTAESSTVVLVHPTSARADRGAMASALRIALYAIGAVFALLAAQSMLDPDGLVAPHGLDLSRCACGLPTDNPPRPHGP